MTFPIKPILLPANLKNVKAGELPDGLLVEVKPFGKLHPLAADAYHAMRAKAFADGIKTFKPTSAGDTYRTLASQTAGFIQRFQKEPIVGADTRTWNGTKWYLKAGYAPLASPGSSNHNLGLAVDISEASGERLNWMLKNALDFGWSWEVQSEPWHLRYVAGDKVPAPVLEWKKTAI